MKRTLPILALFSAVSFASAQELKAVSSVADGAWTLKQSVSSKAPAQMEFSSTRFGLHEASAYADYGILRAYGHSVAGSDPDNPNDYNGFFGSGIASFTDSLKFTTTDSHDDSRGYVTFTYKVDGTHSSSGLGPSGFYDPDLNYAARSVAQSTLLQDGNKVQELRQENRAGHLSGDDFLGKTQTVTLGFNWGESFTLGLSITASAISMENTGQSATSDLAHTALWGGIVSVTDSSGNALNYTLSSGSGHDWSQASTEAVPEPTTMAALGLGALGLIRRRFRK